MAPWHPSLNRLQAALADLYPTEDDARRIASQAGLTASRIEFDGAALYIWHNVLIEAARGKQMAELVGVAAEEYPEYQELQDAYAEYLARTPPSFVQAARRGPVPWALALAAIVAAAVLITLLSLDGLREGGSNEGAGFAAAASPTAATTPSVTHAPRTSPTETTSPPATSPPTVEEPLQTPTPPPDFVATFAYDLESWTDQVEYRVDPALEASTSISDFLRLSAVEIGALVQPDREVPAYHITLGLRNTFENPIALDLNQRFFRMEDNKGRDGMLVYFCCPASGEILPPGQEREIDLIFRAHPGWFTKTGAASYFLLSVSGLRPVLSAVWQLQGLATAD